VNLASRLEAAATPGEILISYETYAAVRQRIHCEERGRISVKGFAYPVATYQVVDAYENVSAVRGFIHEERRSLRLDLGLDAMSADDRQHAAAVLHKALDRLSAVDQAVTRSEERILSSPVEEVRKYFATAPPAPRMSGQRSTDGFSRRPLPRAYCAPIQPISKGRFGSTAVGHQVI